MAMLLATLLRLARPTLQLMRGRNLVRAFSQFHFFSQSPELFVISELILSLIKHE